MRYGMILTAASIADQISAAQTAEKHGFHSVWTLEFFHQHGFVRLGAVGAATERVQVGTAIAYAFMRTPMLAASAAMDIDEITGGRVILGLGSGTRSMNVKWYSMPFDDPPAPRMREAIGLIRAAFAAQKGGGLRFDHYERDALLPPERDLDLFEVLLPDRSVAKFIVRHDLHGVYVASVV